MRFQLGSGSLSRASRQTAGGRGCLTVFFSVFLVMGAIFTIIVLGEALREAAVWFWPEVPCTVLASGVEETGDDSEPYRATVVFEYEVDGRSYSGQKVTRAAASSSSYDTARRTSDRYPPGTATTCRINPEIRGDAVLQRRLPWIGLIVFLPLIFVAVGGGGIYGVWRSGSGATGDGIVESISQRAKKGRGKTIELILGLIFTAIGGGLSIFLLVVPLVGLVKASSWMETPATVVGSTLRSWSTDDGTSYQADVLYEYSAGGRTWTSNRRDFFPFSSGDADGAKTVLARYPQGSTKVCFVDPADPSRSVLEPKPHAAYLIGLFPLIFLIAGVGLTTHALRARPGSRPDAPPTLDDGESHMVERVLKPEAGPIAKVVGMTFVAAFWNGIVGVFVWQAVKGFQNGSPEWFLMVFLTPFVLVGLALIGGIFYTILGAFNPRPTLKISPGAPRLGTGLHIDWSFRGKAGRISHFEIVLEGHEKATYRRGTDSYTDREAFASIVLVDTSSDWEIARGSTDVDIPEDTMHSLASDNNAVVWSLNVHGDIARWPDVMEDFEIEVRPLTRERLLPR